MKKIFLLSLLWFSVGSLSGQDPGRPVQLPQPDKLQLKSSAQRRTGTILLSTGSTMILVGLIMTLDDASALLEFDGSDKDNATAEGILFFGGIAVVASSIPLYIAAHRNETRRMEVSIKPVRVPSLAIGQPGPRSIPALSLKIRI